ncbi:MAG: hypothetical protein K2J67_11445 [Lachnospiraceae bacterium]|nr:hypothetical protein [Lachnospiraceae bacterium]
MVNEKKGRLMTQLALDETKYCRAEIAEAGYYRSDYVRSHTLRVIWGSTLSYLLIIALIALYHMEYLLLNLVRLDYHSLVLVAVGIYVGFLTVCMVIAVIYYSNRYKKNIRKLKAYLADLKKLEEFYAEDQEGDTA